MKTVFLLVNTLLITSAACHADVGTLPMPDELAAGHQAKLANIRQQQANHGRTEKPETAVSKADRQRHVAIARTHHPQAAGISKEQAVIIKTTLRQAAKRLPVIMNEMVSLLNRARVICARTIVTLQDRGIKVVESLGQRSA